MSRIRSSQMAPLALTTILACGDPESMNAAETQLPSESSGASDETDDHEETGWTPSTATASGTTLGSTGQGTGAGEESDSEDEETSSQDEHDQGGEVDSDEATDSGTTQTSEDAGSSTTDPTTGESTEDTTEDSTDDTTETSGDDASSSESTSEDGSTTGSDSGQSSDADTETSTTQTTGDSTTGDATTGDTTTSGSTGSSSGSTETTGSDSTSTSDATTESGEDETTTTEDESDASDDGSESSEGCDPGETQPCYTGPFGTRGIGDCKDGTSTCRLDGTWGDCRDETWPTQEVCGGGDEDCDGLVDPIGVKLPDAIDTEVGIGQLPRFEAFQDGYLLAYVDEFGKILVQKVSVDGELLDVSAPIIPEHPVTELALGVREDRFALAWAADQDMVETELHWHVYDGDLVELSEPRKLEIRSSTFRELDIVAMQGLDDGFMLTTLRYHWGATSSNHQVDYALFPRDEVDEDDETPSLRLHLVKRFTDSRPDTIEGRRQLWSIPSPLGAIHHDVKARIIARNPQGAEIWSTDNYRVVGPLYTNGKNFVADGGNLFVPWIADFTDGVPRTKGERWGMRSHNTILDAVSVDDRYVGLSFIHDYSELWTVSVDDTDLASTRGWPVADIRSGCKGNCARLAANGDTLFLAHTDSEFRGTLRLTQLCR